MAYKDPGHGRARDRERYRRRTAERLARGMCPRCGEARPVPDHSLCQSCGDKRRQAERARCAKARAAGILYAGRDAERCRRSASDRSKRRDGARRDAGLCTRCGKQEPLEGRTVCEPCREARGEREREQYAARRDAGECGKCGAPAPDGSARCERCARSAAKSSKRPDGFRRRIPHLGVRAGKSHLINALLCQNCVRQAAPGRARKVLEGRRRRTPEAASVTSDGACEGFA